MSGDVGLHDEPILFYSQEMTMAKLIVLKHKGVKYSLYSKAMKKIQESDGRQS